MVYIYIYIYVGKRFQHTYIACCWCTWSGTLIGALNVSLFGRSIFSTQKLDPFRSDNSAISPFLCFTAEFWLFWTLIVDQIKLLLKAVLGFMSQKRFQIHEVCVNLVRGWWDKILSQRRVVSEIIMWHREMISITREDCHVYTHFIMWLFKGVWTGLCNPACVMCFASK